MAEKKLKRGVFVTFEGVEGCGKSTHSRLIYRYLKRRGYPCLYTKEPGGTRVGDRIRKILLNPRNKSLSDIAELFLFEASRSQIINEAIRPALKRKMIVLCDRFSDATMAYQGYGAGLERSLIKRLNSLATGGVRPDLTIILDIGIKRGLKRAARLGRRDRMEERPLSFHNRVRKGYIEIAKRDPRRVKLIATKEETAQTHRLIKDEVLNVLARYKTAG